MSEIFKNKDLISKYKKYFYFIPCYDIINNEIYFFEFYTEKIVTKPKKLTKIKKKQLEIELNQSPNSSQFIISRKKFEKSKRSNENKKTSSKRCFFKRK